MTKDVVTAETQANNAQTLLDQKRNAFWRKVDNQDFERRLEGEKEHLIVLQTQLTTDQTRLAEIETLLPNSSGEAKANLRVERSILGLDIDQNKIDIADLTSNIASLESENALRQEEQAFQVQIETL
jgi:hypothetical protein